ncbi:metallophosphoesterase [Alcaligenaceae bacterium B3P038]|nr:metallophosphoesterase [Alcaligenaceae bacterium B3P038]
MRPSSFLVRFIAMGIALHVYVGARLIPPLGLSGAGVAGAILALVVLVCIAPAGMLSRRISRQPLSDRVAWVGFLAMGFFSSLFVLTLLRDVGLILYRLARWAGDWAEPAQLMRDTAMLVPIAAVLVTLIGLYNARRRAPLRHVTVPQAGMPPALASLRIVQLSDIHVGPTIKRGYVQAIVEAVNAQQPDLVVITGDLVDGSVAALAPHIAPLGALRARHGVFVVTGNHEYYAGAPAWVAHFQVLGMRPLMNEHVVIDHDGATFVLAGITDYNAGGFVAGHRSDPVKAMAGAPTDVAVRIVLAHQPRSAPAAAHAGFTLQLSGHTHGGQFLPWPAFVRFQQPFVFGLRQLNGMWIYISRGTGYWGPPKRFFAPSEITCLRLRDVSPQ